MIHDSSHLLQGSIIIPFESQLEITGPIECVHVKLGVEAVFRWSCNIRVNMYRWTLYRNRFLAEGFRF